MFKKGSYTVSASHEPSSTRTIGYSNTYTTEYNLSDQYSDAYFTRTVRGREINSVLDGSCASSALTLQKCIDAFRSYSQIYRGGRKMHFSDKPINFRTLLQHKLRSNRTDLKLHLHNVLCSF